MAATSLLFDSRGIDCKSRIAQKLEKYSVMQNRIDIVATQHSIVEYTCITAQHSIAWYYMVQCSMSPYVQYSVAVQCSTAVQYSTIQYEHFI